jgi:hypothetical protein
MPENPHPPSTLAPGAWGSKATQIKARIDALEPFEQVNVVFALMADPTSHGGRFIIDHLMGYLEKRLAAVERKASLTAEGYDPLGLLPRLPSGLSLDRTESVKDQAARTGLTVANIKKLRQRARQAKAAALATTWHLQQQAR